MTTRRLVIVGAGLCGSTLAHRLRNSFDVTVIERGRKSRPVYDDVLCGAGGVNTTINRAAGLGGTTNYWHNALIELEADDLQAAGVAQTAIRPYYDRAWSLFLSPVQLGEARQLQDENSQLLSASFCTPAHMVVPYSRNNMWRLAARHFPGKPIRVTSGQATRIHAPAAGRPGRVELLDDGRSTSIEADVIICSAGCLATPTLLVRSAEAGEARLGGYHDHPMAYIAKLRLRPESALKAISCRSTTTTSVRTGFAYEVDGLKSVFYLRPALSLGLASITGEARYLLSDLRNDPFSPRKLLQLLTNLEAIREGLLFKTRSSYSGDHYSVLMLGEQEAAAERGLDVPASGPPLLNWHVSDRELAAYAGGFARFLDDMRADIIAVNAIPTADWEFRTGAHHSGAAVDLLAPPTADDPLALFRVSALPGVYACDGSMLRRGGIANSGLTLTALALQLADELARGSI